MKAIIRYFSGTGNTRFVAEVFARQLAAGGYTVDCESIENGGSVREVPANGDLLIIGGPIMAGNVPEKLIRWVLREVSSVPQGEALVFTTSAGLENAHGVHSLSRKLDKKGYRIVGQPLFPMPRNYYFGRYEPTPREEQERLVSEVPGKVTEALAWLKEDRREFPLQGRGKVLAHDLMAELFSLMARGMGRNFTSFSTDCTKCGRCVRDCPQKKIEVKPGGGVVFCRCCMLCTRCLHNCPADAIGYGGVKYMRYSGPSDRNKTETRRSS